MIRSVRKRRDRSDRVNYLASVSDLMSGLLFVFILTLAVAIIQARSAAGKAEEEARNAQQAAEEARIATLRANEEAERARGALEKAKETEANLREVQGRLTIVEERLEGNSRALKALLQQVRKSLAEKGIAVDVDTVRGVLRVPESAVTFGVGLNSLDESNIEKVKLIGSVLEKELPCYQPESMKIPRCMKMNPNGNTLDAVFIEGHTDNQAYRGDETGRRNRLLSTARSNAVFDAMVVGNPGLEGLKNIKNERLFSLSGYGASRPLPGHEHSVPTNDPANRRIEFRFIMTPPAISEEESRLIRTETEAVKSGG